MVRGSVRDCPGTTAASLPELAVHFHMLSLQSMSIDSQRSSSGVTSFEHIHRSACIDSPLHPEGCAVAGENVQSVVLACCFRQRHLVLRWMEGGGRSHVVPCGADGDCAVSE